jgi:hypothetical protein
VMRPRSISSVRPHSQAKKRKNTPPPEESKEKARQGDSGSIESEVDYVTRRFNESSVSRSVGLYFR